MSSFHDLGDDFAGHEENQEWDAAWKAYTSGAETAASAEPAPLRAVLRLPGGLVQLRGAVDERSLAMLADLRDLHVEDVDELDPDRTASSVSLTVHDGTTWRIDHDGVGTVDEGSDPDALAPALLDRIERASLQADQHHLHLDAACVEIDGTGVVLAGGTRARRDELVHSLLRSGAHHVTADDLVLQPGTRTVKGTAAPLRIRTADGDAPGALELVPASTLAPVATRAAVGAIVLLAEESPNSAGETDNAVAASSESAAGTMVPLSAGVTVLRLLETVREDSPLTEDALELVAMLTAGATCVELPATASDPVGLVRSIQIPERRRLAVVSRSAPARGRTSSPSSPTRLVRFDREAVVDEGGGRPPRLLTVEESDELEGRLVSARRTRPGPEAFGLPDCPVGDAARRLWAGQSILEPVGTEQEHPSPAPDLPTGVAAELVGRDLIPTDDAQRRRVIARHVAARERAEVCRRVLKELLGAADEVLVEPVVVGSLVQADDGPLPAHFTDLDRLDLLVRKEHLDLLAEHLEDQGYERDLRTVSTATLTAAADVRLHHRSHPEVLIDLHRTLAAGPFGELVDPDEFHRRAVPFLVGDRWAMALHPEHRFVHSCVRADRGAAGPHTAELREVVLAAPRTSSQLAEMMECSARWGATTSVLAIARRIDSQLPGLPAWLVERATRYGESPRRRREGLRGRRSRR